MTRQCGGWLCGVSMVAAAVALPAAAFADSAAVQNKKPSIKLKANPAIGMPPFRVVVTAELTGGSNDFEDFYCASVEWDWGDGTTSEVKADCDPSRAGQERDQAPLRAGTHLSVVRDRRQVAVLRRATPPTSPAASRACRCGSGSS